MVGWHHQLKGHEFEQTPRYSEGQGSLMCCGRWGREESDTTQQLDNKKGTSLVVQWLKLQPPNAEDLDLIPGQGTRSHIPNGAARIEYYSALEKKAVLSHGKTWMDPEDTMPSEIS